MKIYCVTGQTATGKTSFALNRARECNGELINCDSRQIYKHLDIITGKDLTDKTFHSVHKNNNFDIGYYKRMTKVWLYDIVDPKTRFSSFDYQQCAIDVIKDIIARGKTPIIVGGTYFYLKHVLYDIASETIEPDWKLRHELEDKSVEELQNILRDKSEMMIDSLNQSDRNNPQRLIRKIEIASTRHGTINRVSTNRITLSDKLKISTLDIESIGLKYDKKEALHCAIEKRVEERIQNGAIQEVEQLLKQGYKQTDPGLRTIGYQQIIKYLKKEYSKTQAIKEWITKENQYAKRQYTFMKKDININWKQINSA